MMSRPAALAFLRVVGRHDAVVGVEGQQCERRRRDDVDALLLVADEVRQARQVRDEFGIVEIDGLPAEAGSWLTQ